MLKFLRKDILVGMGAGFIISGIMMAYFGIGQPTDDEIRARAAKLGMSQQTGAEKDQTNGSSGQDNSNTETNDYSSSLADTQGSSKSASADKPVTTDKPVNNDNSATTDKSKTNGYSSANAVSKVTYVIIEVKSGMGSETIARILEEKGVVKDRNEFYRVVTAKRAHSRFKVGKFSVPAGGNMEVILNILTGK